MSLPSDRATVFGEIAEAYDRLRPRYPEPMFDDLVAETGLSPGAPMLEIGCGTGIATAALVRRGLDVLAMDPDSRMLEVARARVQGARFVEGRFETYSGDPESFSLVFAAGSWHWVDAEAALPLAASLLTRNGSLAVCWNLPRPESLPRPLALDAAYRDIAPELAGLASQVRNRDQEHRRAVIAESGWFDDPVSFRYQWSRALTTTEYCGLLSTHSDHRMLGEDRLARLLAAVGEVIDADGGAIRLAYETVLYTARRRS